LIIAGAIRPIFKTLSPWIGLRYPKGC
jgi:hypothetical protein